MKFDGWSLERAAWERAAEVLRGTHWRRVPLDQLYRDSVPTRAGVYLLTTASQRLAARYQLPEVLANAMYVGRSDNLRHRFLRHAKPVSQNPLIARCHAVFGHLDFVFAVVPVAHSEQGSAWSTTAESGLIQVLNPPANRNVPRGRPLVAKVRQPQRV